MSLEAIKTVGEAEAAAKRIKAEAEAEAKRAVGEAEAAGKAMIEAACKKAEDELLELNKKADEKASAEARELAAGVENKKAVMRAKAESRIDEAAGLVIERIVNS